MIAITAPINPTPYTLRIFCITTVTIYTASDNNDTKIPTGKTFPPYLLITLSGESQTTPIASSVFFPTRVSPKRKNNPASIALNVIA